MIRIYFFLFLIMMLLWLFWVYPHIKRTPREQFVSGTKKLVGWIGIGVFVVLVISGRLNWLLASIGLVISFVMRLTPILLKYMPELHKLWTLLQFRKNTQHKTTDSVGSSAITKAEALEILGLKPGASKVEIIAAHRKLISRFHPDKGGSDYLATQINLAKKVLLKS